MNSSRGAHQIEIKEFLEKFDLYVLLSENWKIEIQAISIVWESTLDFLEMMLLEKFRENVEESRFFTHGVLNSPWVCALGWNRWKIDFLDFWVFGHHAFAKTPRYQCQSFLGVHLKFAWLKTSKNSISRTFSRKILTMRRHCRTFWMPWRHVRWFTGIFWGQNNKTWFRLANFYRVVRSLLDFSLATKCTKWASKMQKYGPKCEKLHQNDVSAWVMTQDMQK